MIQNINYKDFYINQKYTLDESSEEYDIFWDSEEERCKEGVYIDGEFINLYLYWHLNYWHADISVLGLSKKLIEKYINLYLRDNEWIIFDSIYRAEQEQKGLCIFGSRRISKSTFSSSYISHGVTFDENSQNIVSGLNSLDIKLVTDKIDKGLNMLLKRFRWMRIEDNWKSQVTFGIKFKDGLKKLFSQILIRNLDNGNNQEAIAGTKLRKLLIDEAGKGNFLSGLQAAELGFTTLYGWGCSLIILGTGGDMFSFQDAKKLFFKLEEYNFLEFSDLKSKRKTGLFLGHTFRQESKFDSTLGDYLNIKNYNSDLYNILIKVSDKELAEKITNENREKKANTGNNIDYMQEIMYFLKTVDEIFMNGNDNQFPLEEIEKVLIYLKENRITGQYVRLYRDSQNKVQHKFCKSGNLLIQNWLAEKWEDKDALIQVWEFLEPNALWGLYVAGCLLLGEKVMTDSGLKSIETVNYNDKLINEKGNLVNINKFLAYNVENEDTYKIKMSNTYRTTTFTKEHLILVSEHKKKSNNNIDFNSFKFDFKKISEVKETDWVKVLNIYNKENNFDLNDIFLNLYNLKLWWLIGLFLGDGYTSTKKGSISYCINILETNTINKIYSFVKEVFKKDCYKKEKNGCVEISFTCKEFSTFLDKNFGKYSYGKFILEWAKKINKENKLELLLGYLDSDGSISVEKKRNYYSLNYISINLKLLEDIQEVGFSIGLVSALRRNKKERIEIINNKICNCKEQYSLYFNHYDTLKFALLIKKEERDSNIKLSKLDMSINSKNKKKKSCFIEGDYIYIQIKEIEKNKYTGLVYNFNCETNTFMCHHITTHNCDPYNQSSSEYSTSLGTCYIYKRMIDISGTSYYNMPVASYSARLKTMNEWHENVEMLLEWYNSIAMVENEGTTLIQYFDQKKKIHYLADGLTLAKEINLLTTTTSRIKGLAATLLNINYCMSLLYEYCKERVQYGTDENNNLIYKLGIWRILDLVLLEEMKGFSKDSNSDRIVALRHALAYAKHLDKYQLVVKRIEEYVDETLYTIKSSPFVKGIGVKSSWLNKY